MKPQLKRPNKRVIITLNEGEYHYIEEQSKRMGLPPSTYCKYLLLREILPQEDQVFVELMNEMNKSLDEWPSGRTFIISSLFEPVHWAEMSATNKKSLSQTLKRLVQDNPDLYEKTNKTMPDKTCIYKKK